MSAMYTSGDPSATLTFKYSGKTYNLEVHSTDLVLDLKTYIYSLTNVPPERQKIIGLTKTLPADDTSLEHLVLTKLKPFTLIGTPDGGEVKRKREEGDTSNSDDDISDPSLQTPEMAARNARKIEEAVARLKDVAFMNEPRRDRKLLVFDLDFTLLDCTNWLDESVDMRTQARPHLHDTLATLYQHYDILIWSQTNWRFLEAKLIELNMIQDRYSITGVLDKTSMFEVVSHRSGQKKQHHVKPLQIIWDRWPTYWSAANTLHIDDLARNFVLNPENGIKIRAFKNASEHQNDRELKLLSAYLLSVKDEPDLRTCDVKNWRKTAKLLAGET